MTRRSNTTPYATRSGPRSSAILAAAVLMAVALPVSVVFPREAEPPTLAATQSTFAIPAASIQPNALAPAAIHVTSTASDWSDGPEQSIYMLIVGSLLIGIGSVVRRTA